MIYKTFFGSSLCDTGFFSDNDERKILDERNCCSSLCRNSLLAVRLVEYNYMKKAVIKKENTKLLHKRYHDFLYLNEFLYTLLT